VFLQCTSPVRRPGEIDGAVDELVASGSDSLFSACRTHAFLWRLDGAGPAPLLHDHTQRKRGQELEDRYRENGSIYVFKPWVLRQLSNRLGGAIGMYEMDFWSSFEIDEPAELELCDWIVRRPEYLPVPRWPERIELIVLDFDGVMTDNRVLVDERGGEAVWCSRADGWGIARLREAGIPVIVLSTERNAVVRARCGKLGIDCHSGIDDKEPFLLEYLRQRSIPAQHVIYVGNDRNDEGCLGTVGLSVVVGDAHPAVRACADLVLTGRGGHGAIRELADLVLARLGRVSELRDR
jgi:YrbI family 3-deoxy-D-manno-octulosonate 8-phosphate phosphatase